MKSGIKLTSVSASEPDKNFKTLINLDHVLEIFQDVTTPACGSVVRFGNGHLVYVVEDIETINGILEKSDLMAKK